MLSLISNRTINRDFGFRRDRRVVAAAVESKALAAAHVLSRWHALWAAVCAVSVLRGRMKRAVVWSVQPVRTTSARLAVRQGRLPVMPVPQVPIGRV